MMKEEPEIVELELDISEDHRIILVEQFVFNTLSKASQVTYNILKQTESVPGALYGAILNEMVINYLIEIVEDAHPPKVFMTDNEIQKMNNVIQDMR